MEWLTWDDLTEAEKEQAENSFLSMMEDCADNGDTWDKAYYFTLLAHRDKRIEVLKYKRFERQKDGYIFVNI